MTTTQQRALIVIDPQNEYITGKLRVTYPSLPESLSNIGRAMDIAHAAGVPIVMVQHIAPAVSPIFGDGSLGADLHPAVAQRPYDHLITKAMPSSFEGTGLLDWLRARGIDTLTVVGFMTQNCVASTVVQAVHHGLTVEVLDDATGAVPYQNGAGAASGEEIHRVYMTVFQSRYAAVGSTAAWCESMRSGVPLPRDSIFNSSQRALAHHV